MVQYGAGLGLGWVIAGAALATLMSGCASDPQVGTEVSELHKKLITVENDNARLELRIASLESQVDHLGSRNYSTPESGTSRPRLKVIRLSPENETSSAGPVAEEEQPTGSSGEAMPASTSTAADVQDTSRPVIHVEGDKVIETGTESSGTGKTGSKGKQRGDG